MRAGPKALGEGAQFHHAAELRGLHKGKLLLSFVPPYRILKKHSKVRGQGERQVEAAFFTFFFAFFFFFFF